MEKLWPKTAMVLAKLHSEKNYDGSFQEVNNEFCRSVGMSMFQFRRVRDFWKMLGLFEIKRVWRPNRTNISLKKDRYEEIRDSEQTDYGNKI